MQNDRILELAKLKKLASGDTSIVEVPAYKAYGYTRVSHVNSLKKGDSLPAQEHRIKTYCENFLKSAGVELAGIFNDGMNISAYSVPFSMRPAGKLILSQINPGDHIVLDKVDRIWRSIEDFCSLMKYFRSRNITVHIVNFLGQSIQNNTVLGDFILRQFVMVAELESAIKSERIKEGLAHARKKRPMRQATHAPPGTVKYKYDGGDRIRYALKWDPDTRAFMREVVRILDSKATRFRAYTELEEVAAKREGREPRPWDDTYVDRTYTWRKMHMYEQAYMYLGIEDPNKIPTVEIIREASRQYKRVYNMTRLERNQKNRHLGIEPIEPHELLNIANSH